MTYCVAIKVSQGLVFASDSRTNAGADQLSTVSKMHQFDLPADRAICLLNSGNLATTQAVIRQIGRDIEKNSGPNLATFNELAQAAEYIGQLNRRERGKHSSKDGETFSPEASFILGGQIGKRPHQIYQIYPEGNYISANRLTPYLQIGELKYGKPILDRIIKDEISLEMAARCALVSMDSTMKSNATVGPPIELLNYSAGSLRLENPLLLTEDNPYWYQLRMAWQEGLQQAFENLPNLPFSRPSPHLVDAKRGDR